MKFFLKVFFSIHLVVACNLESNGVCLCTGKACDSVAPIGSVEPGQYVMYQTSKGGDRLKRTTGSFASKADRSHFTIKLSPEKTHQSIIGFGGALTDASILNINKMNEDVQQQLFQQYFGPDGIGYTLGRIPMAGSDFSTHSYTYDDHPGDLTMSNFSIDMDMDYKIPYIKKVIENSARKVKLFASPWSPPAWLKSNNKTVGGTFISKTPGDQYHKAWALYFEKFLTQYSQQGIDFWGITLQNEPATPKIYGWDSCNTSPEEERDFIKMHVGPLLNATHPSVKIIMHDDQRSHLPSYTAAILGDPEAAAYVAGVGFHWYSAVEDTIPFFFQSERRIKEVPR